MGRVDIKSIRDEVKEYLINVPHTRDSDERLIANIWKNKIFKITGKQLSEMTAFDFVKIYSEDKLPKAESIRRSRQKLQEHNIYLRGESYKKRKDSEDDVKGDLNNYDD